MNELPASADSFGQIADQFVAAYRQGQRPSVEEYVQRYPEHAETLRKILPALLTGALQPGHAAGLADTERGRK
ncbi:MAG: hypothetical protein L0Z62_11575 [Gemmataceae bacterium]|nr:hypothetical protein [Gemmataceae bacterium]